MAKGDDIDERMIDFAVRIIAVCQHLPATPAGKHIAGQLIRSGTAPAAHDAEARGAESTRDFIHKLRICSKELNESQVWLKIAAKSDLIPAAKLQDLIQECTELSRIINANISTAKSRKN